MEYRNQPPKYGEGELYNTPNDAGTGQPDQPHSNQSNPPGTPVTGDPDYRQPYQQGTGQQAGGTAGEAQQRAKDVAGTARDETKNVAQTARSAGTDVVDSARQQAGEVAGEARYQGRQLLDQGLAELRSQAGTGQRKVAEIVRSFSGELDSMVQGSQQQGPVTDLARNAQSMGRRAADWLDDNGPDEALTAVRRYAARNPWQFMAICAGVGFVGARLFRGLQDEQSSGHVRETGYGYGTQGYGSQGYGSQGYGSAGRETSTGPAGDFEPGRPVTGGWETSSAPGASFEARPTQPDVPTSTGDIDPLTGQPYPRSFDEERP